MDRGQVTSYCSILDVYPNLHIFDFKQTKAKVPNGKVRLLLSSSVYLSCLSFTQASFFYIKNAWISDFLYTHSMHKSRQSALFDLKVILTDRTPLYHLETADKMLLLLFRSYQIWYLNHYRKI